MPCFKGIAVSIHANGAPLPEHGIQKQSRMSRINSYIPVPAPQLSSESGKPEGAKFAISITLLTPGLAIPYSTPKATDANPYPKPHVVGELPSSNSDSKFAGIVTPYIPMTNSENETIAAYIYFDGRPKEEVATLLRPGEETWVNSRWVQVPNSEGGGLAEREFLFREMGLERWLNGLDLEGHDAAAKLEKRRQRFEKRRRRQELQQKQNGSSTTPGGTHRRKSSASRDLRYGGADEQSPVEALEDDDLSDDSLSSDDEPPEATGQIKVAMFRVLASGEIKKGEYSPQFDAHDDDDAEGSGNGGGGVDADVEHTTSFAKPKTLDPKTISTQTVTGIDGPDKPYATFTFFYRGERQLQKVGIIPSAKNAQQTSTDAKRKSAQLDFSSIGPLKTAGTVGFSTFRDHENEPARQKKTGHKRNGSVANANNAMDEDSDDDDDDDDKILGKIDDADDKDVSKSSDRLAPEDAQFSGELADGVNRIRLKRQHSVDPDSATASSNNFRKSPSTGPFGGELTPTEGSGATPSASGLASGVASAVSGGAGSASGDAAGLSTSANSGSLFGKSLPDDSAIGSPLKRHRASVAEGSDSDPRSVFSSGAFPPALGDILAKAEAAYGRTGGSNAQTGSGLGSALGGSLGSTLGTSPTATATAATTKSPTVKEEEEEL
ncbi:hypothetical protein Sste5346_002799 [Sporothrix stenoceras]|uniref:DUF7918 domain-containing protein n=1 Tax=Sporothrix stenoceras TaxID=5173 RepID=A0ABR3ZGU4_9PEZI